MPSSPDHFFLAFPIELDGAETEGGTATPVADASEPIVVDVLGHAPAAGDILTAYAVGGRWVAERGQSEQRPDSLARPAISPRKILTSRGSMPSTAMVQRPLSYTATPTSWTSGCSNDLLYKLVCTGGQVELRVIYFTDRLLSHRHATVLLEPASHALRSDPLQLHVLAVFHDLLVAVVGLPGDHQQRIHAVYDHHDGFRRSAPPRMTSRGSTNRTRTERYRSWLDQIAAVEVCRSNSLSPTEQSRSGFTEHKKAVVGDVRQSGRSHP